MVKKKFVSAAQQRAAKAKAKKLEEHKKMLEKYKQKAEEKRKKEKERDIQIDSALKQMRELDVK